MTKMTKTKKRLMIVTIAVGTVLAVCAPLVAGMLDEDPIDYPEGQQPMPEELGEDVWKPSPVESDAPIAEVLADYLPEVGLGTDRDSIVLLHASGVDVVAIGNSTDPIALDVPGRSDDRSLQALPVWDTATSTLSYHTADNRRTTLDMSTVGSATVLVDVIQTPDSGWVAVLTERDGVALGGEYLEGEHIDWSLSVDGTNIEIPDGELIPLTTHPDGGFVVTLNDGSPSRVARDGQQQAIAELSHLPPAWSASYGPNGLLALGLSTNQVVVVGLRGETGVFDDLPLASPIDVTWGRSGTLYVNLSGQMLNDSGVFACDLQDGTCHKVAAWQPYLRLAEAR